MEKKQDNHSGAELSEELVKILERKGVDKEQCLREAMSIYLQAVNNDIQKETEREEVTSTSLRSQPSLARTQ